MEKILIIQNTILHYRKPLYNALSLYYDVTVLHSGKASSQNEKYNIAQSDIKNCKIFKKLVFHVDHLKSIYSTKYLQSVSQIWASKIS